MADEEFSLTGKFRKNVFVRSGSFRPGNVSRQLLTIFAFIWISVVPILHAEEGDHNDQVPEDLVELSFEELMDIKITSVSKREQKVSQAAAAIHVITQEDIRRSGLNSIPELLRTVPGLQVAQFDANTWAITSRGFNSRFASKLLVLIDGRSIYTPIFSGINWDDHDIPLEDIERIEVIRGPGGTLWGANAVNGVINIITKHTEDTQGGLVSGGAGNEENGFSTLRYGGKLSPDATYRVYGKYFNRDESVTRTGGPGNDSSHSARGGFRIDWQASEKNSLMFTGDYFEGESDFSIRNQVFSLTAPFASSFNTTAEIDGAHFLAKWQRQLSADSDIALQAYYNRERRRSQFIPQLLEDTFDIDFQHQFKLNDRNHIIWGLEQRFVYDSLKSNFGFSFDPQTRLNHRSSFFVQDEITLVPNQVRLTLGSKFEANSYTGFEIQPNARILWTPNEDHTVWAAVSRAVRTPSRAEDTARVNVTASAGPVLVTQFGANDYDSEDLLALELGYRVQPKKNLYFDLATFAHFYEHILTQERRTPFVETSPAPAHTVVPIVLDNLGSGEIFGVEAFANWNPFDWWTLKGGLTWLAVDFHLNATSTDTALIQTEDNDPEIQWQLHSHMDLPYELELDTALYYVSELENLNVDDYMRLDVRLGWHATDDIELSLVGQNLTDPEHPEFGNSILSTGTATQVERSVFGKVTWKFDGK